MTRGPLAAILQSTDKIDLLSRDLAYLKSRSHLLTRLENDNIEIQNVRKIYESIDNRLRFIANNENIMELKIIAQKLPTIEELSVEKRSRLIPRLIGAASLVAIIFTAFLFKTMIGTIIFLLPIVLSIIDEFRGDIDSVQESEIINGLNETITQAQYFVDRLKNNN